MTIDPRDDHGRLTSAVRPRARLRLGVGAAIVLLIAALVTAVLVSALTQPPGEAVVRPVDGANIGSAPPTTGELFADAPPSAAPAIFVHLLGAVQAPGLFELPAGSRMMDVVAQAGGLTGTADPTGVNLARVLVDGEQIYVPQVGEVPPAPPVGVPAGGAAGAATGPSAPVNINTATVTELDTLPNVGPMMSQRIVDYRTVNGPFTSIDDLRNVTGIGDKRFEALKDLVTV
ncbi:helix-hairpin-helix domain-containing protein [Cryobacterium sp. CG_9.6]|uniref:helix-hairpin-helix domain-containing protein n=1 Tax=Cryobacterium sp. CG_9.6 TaxID=2760710 RepID=UPI002473603B|nr:helix-hairpin-helix domain-containing protein [Cryobacterium sp. CG_9.6]MDH6237189.1 competence protein ComEA [Cryobacterium sp. CG_9.6]